MKSAADGLVLVLAATAALGSSCTHGKRIGGDASARADASFCVYAGKGYAVGESIPAQDDCGTCSCGANLQVTCTNLACPGDAGLAGQDALTVDGRGMVVADAFAQDQRTAADLATGDGRAVADLAPADVPLASDGAPADIRTVADAGSAAGCSISTTLTFGHDGGKVLYQDSNRLDTSGIMTVTRKPNRGDGGIPSCSWELPACGTPGAVTLATIAADLAAPDVQAAFAASSTPLYGLDERPSDGTVYSIARADGRTVLVGIPCSWRPSEPCQEIPAGVQRLTSDLESLATAALAAPACQGL